MILDLGGSIRPKRTKCQELDGRLTVQMMSMSIKKRKKPAKLIVVQLCRKPIWVLPWRRRGSSEVTMATRLT